MIDNRKNRRLHGTFRTGAKAWYVILQRSCCKYEELHVFLFDDVVGYDVARRVVSEFLGEDIDGCLHGIREDLHERVLELIRESNVYSIHFFASL